MEIKEFIPTKRAPYGYAISTGCDIYYDPRRKGVYPEIANHEATLARLRGTPIFINDIDTSTAEGQDKLDSLLYTKYDGGSISILPSCECGETTTVSKLNTYCPNCSTIVVPPSERPIESNLWIRAPDGVKALINPQMLIILSKAFTINGCNFLEWLLNPTYKNGTHNNLKLELFKAYNFPRGLNAFYDNFDDIVTALLDRSIFNGNNAKRLEVKLFIEQNRDRVFTRYIPIPNRILFITEKAITATYADKHMASALDAVRTISDLNQHMEPPSIRRREYAAAKACLQLASYYVMQYKKIIGGKYGFLRKHLFGTRQAYSFRAVISSLHEAHRMDELHIPWGVAVGVFRKHLESKLLRRGYTPNEAVKLLFDHTLTYHPLLDTLFKEIIGDHPSGKGFPCYFLRNPTLDRLSGQLFHITLVKPDPNIKTVSLSLNVIAPMNADFDGDALGGLLILDKKMYERFERTSQHTGVLDLQKARTLSGKITLPKPVLAIYASWMHEPPADVEEAKLFKKLLGQHD